MNAKFILFTVIIASTIVGGGLSCFAQVRDVSNSYGIAIAVPADWEVDSAQMRRAKTALSEVLTTIRSEGKITILNTGTPPGAPEGYARVRLNITANLNLSQVETAALDEDDLSELRLGFAKEITELPLFRVEKDSVSLAKTRTDDGYWGLRLSYTRTGLNGPVKVDQFYFPFSNRAVQLTLSYQVDKQDVLSPVLLRVLASLRLTDPDLWPKNPS